MNRRDFLKYLGLAAASTKVYSVVGSGLWTPDRQITVHQEVSVPGGMDPYEYIRLLQRQYAQALAEKFDDDFLGGKIGTTARREERRAAAPRIEIPTAEEMRRLRVLTGEGVELRWGPKNGVGHF